MEQAKSVRSEETALRIDSAEWFKTMLRSSRESWESASFRRFTKSYSFVGVASDTTRRLFSVMVPVLSERTCLRLRRDKRVDVTCPSSSMIPAFRTWMWSCEDSKQSRSFSMKKDWRSSLRWEPTTSHTRSPRRRRATRERSGSTAGRRRRSS